MGLSERQAEDSASVMLQATLHIATGKKAKLQSSSGIFMLPDAECFEHLAEGKYRGIFELIFLQQSRYEENGKLVSLSQAVVIDYHLETPEVVKESPGFFDRFLEGFAEGWNAPPPERRQRRQNRKHL
jgi:hypothetical protein